MATRAAEIVDVQDDVPQTQEKATDEQPPAGEPRGLQQRLRAWVRGEYDYERPRRGEVREAIILDIGENDILVDLGVKRDGVVPRRDMELLEEGYLNSLQVGDRVPVAVMRSRGRPAGELRVSINKGLQQQDWLRAQELLESEEVVEAEVIDLNRGGVLVSFGRVRGFVPNSHIASISRGLRGDRLRAAKSELVGRTLHVMVLEVNQRRRRLVLSERKAGQQRREQVLRELTPGDVRSGVVTSLVDFGAFVDLGGVDGLVHISELDWAHVDRPNEVLSVGDPVEVYVLDVDRERERIALSRKRLQPDPWYAVTEAIQVGQVARGMVTNTVDFGAFVDLGQGVEGLVHISEMPAGQATLRDIESGTEIWVRVLEIDSGRRRISLSLRNVDQPVTPSVATTDQETLADLQMEEIIASAESGDQEEENVE